MTYSRDGITYHGTDHGCHTCDDEACDAASIPDECVCASCEPMARTRTVQALYESGALYLVKCSVRAESPAMSAHIGIPLLFADAAAYLASHVKRCDGAHIIERMAAGIR